MPVEFVPIGTLKILEREKKSFEKDPRRKQRKISFGNLSHEAPFSQKHSNSTRVAFYHFLAGNTKIRHLPFFRSILLLSAQCEKNFQQSPVQ